MYQVQITRAGNGYIVQYPPTKSPPWNYVVCNTLEEAMEEVRVYFRSLEGDDAKEEQSI